MTSTIIRFAHKTEQMPYGFHGQARNGHVQAHGVYLGYHDGNKVELANITSRNDIANHSTVMPPETMDALAAWWIETRKKE